ncbi:hypothetical protein F2Q68_00008171 [Brassica cretica]|uniref:Rab-GAP TBC domain-containing protein n=1 Tax=Brassica cretica TaxID=69181 RepID=A0A8S9KXH4_BRACR|nr:hypothetical protein F2Q68_00008171 [Brassica cretica]
MFTLEDLQITNHDYVPFKAAGVDPSIRGEVWLFLLGVYDLNSTSEEREAVKSQRRNEYEKLQRRCTMLLKRGDGSTDDLEEEADEQYVRFMDDCKTTKQIINQDVVSAVNTDSSDTDSCEDDDEDVQLLPSDVYSNNSEENNTSLFGEIQVEVTVHEDFSTWQRIIRLDALRADSDWATYSSSSTTITETKARGLAESVALKDYDHLETCRLHHAARLVSILEAYALYDPEIGYCQGMSDLLSPILAVISEDHEAFWSFVGFMKKARHNFRLDEAGIQRQLRIVSKIIKSKDSQLYKHLENLQALFPISGETDEYMIFGRIGATRLFIRIFIWALVECNWMFSSRCVRGDVSVRQSSQELSVSSVMIPKLSRSGYVTFLLPPYFKQSFHEFLLLEITWCDFVNSWGSLLDGGAAACVVLILGLAWFCLLVFGIVDRFRGVSVRTADIVHWELFTYECTIYAWRSRVIRRFVRDGAEFMQCHF